MWIFVLLIVFATGVSAEEGEKERSVYQDAMDFVRGCGNKDFLLCLKERTLKYLNTLPNNIDVGFGLKIKPNDPQQEDTSSRNDTSYELPDEPRAREEALDDVILEKIKQYVRSHTFEYRVPEDTFEVLDASVGEGRKKKGGGGGGRFRLRPMMMLLQVKAALLGALALKVIGVIAFKALLIAKIALTISSIVALKKMVEPKRHTSTYEVVAHPHYDEHYDRAFDSNSPYRGYNGARSIHH